MTCEHVMLNVFNRFRHLIVVFRRCLYFAFQFLALFDVSWIALEIRRTHTYASSIKTVKYAVQPSCFRVFGLIEKSINCEFVCWKKQNISRYAKFVYTTSLMDTTPIQHMIHEFPANKLSSRSNKLSNC